MAGLVIPRGADRSDNRPEVGLFAVREVAFLVLGIACQQENLAVSQVKVIDNACRAANTELPLFPDTADPRHQITQFRIHREFRRVQTIMRWYIDSSSN